MQLYRRALLQRRPCRIFKSRYSPHPSVPPMVPHPVNKRASKPPFLSLSQSLSGVSGIGHSSPQPRCAGVVRLGRSDFGGAMALRTRGGVSFLLGGAPWFNASLLAAAIRCTLVHFASNILVACAIGPPPARRNRLFRWASAFFPVGSDSSDNTADGDVMPR